MKYIFIILSLLFIGCAPQKARNGVNGHDGFTSLLSTTRYEAGLALCPSDSGVEIQTGLDRNRNWVLDTEEANYITIVCDGEPDATPYGISVLIDPCGPQGDNDEIIVRLTDGSLLFHYSHGNKQFLSILSDGNYETTDGTKCSFYVNSGEVTW